MGFFDLYRCPNTNCWWNEKGKEGENIVLSVESN